MHYIIYLFILLSAYSYKHEKTLLGQGFLSILLIYKILHRAVSDHSLSSVFV